MDIQKSDGLGLVELMKQRVVNDHRQQATIKDVKYGHSLHPEVL